MAASLNALTSRLAARGIGINEVEASLRNWNANVHTGSMVGAATTYALQASGEIEQQAIQHLREALNLRVKNGG